MAIKLFVAGLSYAMDDNNLREMFAEYGTVSSAKIITDRDTNRSKGFGFVEFEDDAAGNAAIAGLNGKEVDGRSLAVNVARPREDRPTRSFQDNRNTMGNNYRRSRR